MTQSKILDQYYNKQNTESLNLLEDEYYLKKMLKDKNLLLFMRYLERLDKIDINELFRTLLLTIHLLKIDRDKVKPIIPFDKDTLIRIKKWTKCRSFQSELLQKIAIYLITLLDRDDQQGEIEVLTAHLVSVYHIIQYTNQHVTQYAKAYYSLAQNSLLSLWKIVHKNIDIYQYLSPEEFGRFYQQYSQFCKYLRKIPKIRNSHLKTKSSDRITIQEFRERQIRLERLVCASW